MDPAGIAVIASAIALIMSGLALAATRRDARAPLPAPPTASFVLSGGLDGSDWILENRGSASAHTVEVLPAFGPTRYRGSIGRLAGDSRAPIDEESPWPDRAQADADQPGWRTRFAANVLWRDEAGTSQVSVAVYED